MSTKSDFPFVISVFSSRNSAPCPIQIAKIQLKHFFKKKMLLLLIATLFGQNDSVKINVLLEIRNLKTSLKFSSIIYFSSYYAIDFLKNLMLKHSLTIAQKIIVEKVVAEFLDVLICDE